MRRASDFSNSLGHLVASAQPAVVFSSLAALSVARFADACRVVITESDDFSYRIQRPLVHVGAPLRALLATPLPTGSLERQTVDEHTVSTPILGPAGGGGEPAYAGTVVHYWLGTYRPTALDANVALLAVDLAVSAVDAERAASTARTHREVLDIGTH